MLQILFSREDILARLPHKMENFMRHPYFPYMLPNLLKLLSSKLEPEKEAVDNSKATLYAFLTLNRPFGVSAHINLSASSCKLKEMLLIVSTSKGKKN